MNRPQERSLMSMNDEDLVDAAREGNDAASVVLVARYKDTVMHCASRVAGSQELGLEAALRTMEIVRRTPARIAGGTKCAANIYRLTLGVTRDLLREEKKRFRLRAKRIPPPPVFELDGGPPEEFTENESAKVQRCLCLIPLKYRGLLVLRDVLGLSYEDLTAVLGERLERVRTKSDKARDLLHMALMRREE